MKFSFNKDMLDLDRNPIVTNGAAINLSKLLAQNLTQLSKGDAIKFMDWAHKLWKGDDLELDRADANTLKDLIKNFDGVSLLAKAQWLEILSAAQEN